MKLVSEKQKNSGELLAFPNFFFYQLNIIIITLAIALCKGITLVQSCKTKYVPLFSNL